MHWFIIPHKKSLHKINWMRFDHRKYNQQVNAFKLKFFCAIRHCCQLLHFVFLNLMKCKREKKTEWPNKSYFIICFALMYVNVLIASIRSKETLCKFNICNVWNSTITIYLAGKCMEVNKLVCYLQAVFPLAHSVLMRWFSFSLCKIFV